MDFVRQKLNKKSAKVRYIKRGPKGTKGPRTKKPKVLRGRKVKGSTYPSSLNLNQMVTDQLEKQAEATATPSESELFRQSREALVLMAKNLGIKNPYRKTKLQLISDLTDLPKNQVVKNIEEQEDEKIEDAVDKGIALQNEAQLGLVGPKIIAHEEKRLGRRLSSREKGMILERYASELNEVSDDLLTMTDFDKQIFADRAAGLSAADIERKYDLNKEDKKPRGRPRGSTNKPKPKPIPRSDQPSQNVDSKMDLPDIPEDDDLRITEADARLAQEAYEEAQDRKEYLDKYGRGVAVGPRTGAVGVDNSDALSNIQIDKIMSPYRDKYLGCCSSNTIERDILPKVKPESKGCFVVNTDKEKGPGEHWCSVFFDATPQGSHSIEFFDSYGDDPDKSIDEGIQKVADKLNCQNYLKYKINSVCWQGNKTGTKKESSNCGYFAVKFLLDRLRGKSFQESTCYDASKVGEKNIESFKNGEGIRKEQIGGAFSFGLLPSFGSTFQKIKEKIFFPSREFSNAFKSVMAKYGNMKIMSARIRRAPIGSTINNLLNILSFGKFDEYRREKNFDKYFHLGLVLQLENGTKLLIEKNYKPEFSENFKDTDKTVYMGPIQIQGQPTLNQFIQKTVDKMGMFKFTNYTWDSNNCQVFILNLLQANNSLTTPLKNFIYQDVSTLLERMPSFVDKIARLTTDTGAKLQELTGNGKANHTGKRRKFTTARRKAIKNIFKNILS